MSPEIPTMNFIRRGRGRPVILVHGIFGSHHQWDQLIPVLVEDGWEAIAPDLLGHGESPMPDEPGGYHIEAVTMHFERWIASQPLEQAPILVGHSLGAYINLCYALGGEAEVAGLFFSNPFFSPDQLTQGIRLYLENTDVAKSVLRYAPHWLIRSALRLSSLNDEKMTRPVRDRVARDYKKPDPEVIEVAGTTRDLTPELHRIRIPTMVVWGEGDLTLQPEIYPEFCDRIPGSEWRSLPGGHNPHLTHPETYNRAVLAFIREVDARTLPSQDADGGSRV